MDSFMQNSLHSISGDNFENNFSQPRKKSNLVKRNSNGLPKREIFFSDEIGNHEPALTDSTMTNSSHSSHSSKSFKSCWKDGESLTLSENEYNVMVGECKMLSIIYGMIIMVLGLLLPIVETAMKPVAHSKQYSDDIFEIILFALSIIWFVYNFFDMNLFQRRRHSDDYEQDYSHDTNRTTGGLYIKIGCGFFCMASLLQNGLLIGEAFEFRNFCGSPLVFIKNLLRFMFTFLQYAFLFKNSHVLIHTKLLLNHLGLSHIIVTNICVWFKFILEEAFDSAKSSGGSSLNNTKTSYLGNANDSNYTLNKVDPSHRVGSDGDCSQFSTQVSDIIETLSPYLHPCAIEYSIISVTLFFEIWYYVGHKREETVSSHARRFSIAAAQTQIFHVDCNKSAKGLFAGFLVGLLTIISLIIFVVAGTTNESEPITDPFKMLALILSECTELMLLLLCLIVALSGYLDMRKMSLAHVGDKFSMPLDVVLEVFALFGVLSFGVFRILSFRYSSLRNAFMYLFLINGIMSFIQGFELKRKRGREQIAFLVILNLSLWLLYTVTRPKYAYSLFQEMVNNNEINEYESEYVKALSIGGASSFYSTSNITLARSPIARTLTVPSASSDNAQSVKWIIINTVTYPLLLYFHFHSSCCLSIMWKMCYHLELESF